MESHKLEAGDDTRSLGGEIRAMRKARGMTLADLAGRARKSVGFLSQVERDLKRPSIGTLQRIAEGLGTSIGWFFQADDGADAFERQHIVRGPARRRLQYTQLGSPDYLGLSDYLLTPSIEGNHALVMSVYRPGASSGDELYTHAGQESGLVLSGRVRLYLGRRSFVLDSGDSFGFESRIPHRYVNEGEQDARVVMAIAPVALRY